MINLEFITWLIGGWDLVNHFSFLRIPKDEDFVLGQDGTKFYVLKPGSFTGGKWNPTAEIKPAVSKVRKLSPMKIAMSHCLPSSSSASCLKTGHVLLFSANF